MHKDGHSLAVDVAGAAPSLIILTLDQKSQRVTFTAALYLSVSIKLLPGFSDLICLSKMLRRVPDT